MSSNNFKHGEQTPDEAGAGTAYNMADDIDAIRSSDMRIFGTVGSMDNSAKAPDRIPARRASKKKARDKPRRPLSAYNYFFKTERLKILAALSDEVTKMEGKEESTPEVLSAADVPEDDPDYLDPETIGRLTKDGGRISFEEMGKLIGQRWKNIDPDRLQSFAELAAEDTERYKKEMLAYNGRQEQKMRTEAAKPTIPTYSDLQPARSHGAGAYGDPSMGYGPPPPGSYYAYSDGYSYPGMGMYPYAYPPPGGDHMSHQQLQMGGPPDGRSGQPPMPQYPMNGMYNGGYHVHYGMQGDGYGPPPPQSGMDPYGNYGSGPPPNWGHQ